MHLSTQIRKHVIGQKIVKIKLNRFYSQETQNWHYDPVIYLENGTVIKLIGTDAGYDMGCEPIIIP